MASNRTHVSARQAAKLAGRSVPTITRAIKSGKLSAEKLAGGTYRIDIAELERAFGLLNARDYQMSQPETPSDSSALQVEIKLLREQIEDLRADRDQWRRQATALLPVAPAAVKPWWKLW